MINEYGYYFTNEVPDLTGLQLDRYWKSPNDTALSKQLLPKACELMCEEMYHCHTKCLIHPSYNWHQDWAYWQKTWVLPNLISVMVRGSLEVLEGSHKASLQPHGKFAEDKDIIPPDRFMLLSNVYEPHMCIAPPNLWFDCNLVHRSVPANEMSLIVTYNAVRNIF